MCKQSHALGVQRDAIYASLLGIALLPPRNALLCVGLLYYQRGNSATVDANSERHHE